VNVVLAVLELLDYLSNQNYDKLRNSVKIVLPNMLVHLDLAVKGIEANINETFDFQFAKEVAQGSSILGA